MTRYKHMRDTYTRVIRRHEATGVLNTKWGLFHKLHNIFSIGGPPPRRQKLDARNLVKEEEDEEEFLEEPPVSPFYMVNEDLEDEHSEIKTETEEDDCSLKLLRRRVEILEAKVAQQGFEDDVDVFMKSISMTMKSFPQNLINEAKVQILQLVNNLQEHALNIE